MTEQNQPPKKVSKFKQLFGRARASDELTPSADKDDAVAERAPPQAAENNASSTQLSDKKSAEGATEPQTIKAGLGKSRKGLLGKISHAFKGSFSLDDDLFDDLEDALITSDVGMDASLGLIERLRARIKEDKLQTAAQVHRALCEGVAESLAPAQANWQLGQSPYVILMVGVNGVGKTTTTAKLAHRLAQDGKRVMMAAADTFRAAAVEQLQHWGRELNIPVIAQSHGADAAAVAHDALTAACARGIDVLLVDTAGRLHTQSDLMEQLEKVTRVMQKLVPDAPHEVMQVVDATTGQNAVNQIDAFQKAVKVSSLVMTKLDGSARGGTALAITERFQLPIRFIGVGEGFDDLRPFSAKQFAEALIPSLSELQNEQ